MARIRTIKPEFFTSEDIVELEPLARLLYVALWCEADKEGRFSWKPKTFKMRYLPVDDCDIDALCDSLVARGLVVRYGDGLAYIPSFGVHQHINPREKDSAFPAPDAENLTRAPRVSDASVTRREEGRKEGKGKERKEEHASSTRAVPPDGVCSETWMAFLAIRKAKKAPISDLAMAGIQREAEKAGWTLEAALSEVVTRGWTAFKADWVVGKQTFAQQAADVARQTVPAKDRPDPALQKIIADGLRAVPPPDGVRARLAELRAGT